MAESILVIPLEGRLDSFTAPAIRQEIERLRAAQEHEALVFEAKHLTYISSTGLRVIMQAIKAEQAQKHAPVSIIEARKEVYEILEMTGLTELIKVEKSYREISLEGSRLIGKGFYGQVFQIDEDTVVKLYADGKASLPLMEREQALARKAFIRGIPTAIPYDIVRVGEQYGTMFELLQARTFNDLVREYEQDRGKLEELMALYVSCLKQVHATEMERGELPLARDIMLGRLQSLQEVLPLEIIGRLQNLLTELPEDLHVVHRDFQMKNVMLCHGEPMLIDMETLCTGQPIFDLQALYVSYKAFKEDEPENAMAFMGLHGETQDYIWQRLLELYFGTEDKGRLKALEDKIRVAAYIRFLYILETTWHKGRALTEVRIKNTRKQLQELLSQVESLSLEEDS